MFAVHVISQEGRTQGPVSGRPIARARPRARNRRSRRRRPPFSGTTGVLIDPIEPLRRAARAGRRRATSFATGMASSRETAPALAQRYREPSHGPDVRARVRPRARGAGCGTSASRARGASCSSALPRGCCTPTDRCGRRPRSSPGARWARRGSGHTACPGTSPSCSCASSSDVNSRSCARCCAAQEYWRLEGLSADVVILNEHPVSWLDEARAARGPPRRRPRRTWQHKRGGAYLLRGDRMAEPERSSSSRAWRAPSSSATAGRSPSSSICTRLRRGSRRHRRPPRPRAGAAPPGPRGRRCRRSRREDPTASPTAGENTSSSSRETRRRPCRGRTSSRAPPRHRRHGVGIGVHLVREQPREPAHAVRERPGQRSDVGGNPRPRRRQRGVVAHPAGTSAPHPEERTFRDPPREPG